MVSAADEIKMHWWVRDEPRRLYRCERDGTFPVQDPRKDCGEREGCGLVVTDEELCRFDVTRPDWVIWINAMRASSS